MTVRSPAAASLAEVVRRHAATLASAGVDSPDADATALARHALGLSPTQLRTLPVDAASAGRLRRLEHLVARRAAREPLQLLTGEAGFRHLVLGSAPGVFVPRPETETLADLAIARCRDAVAARGQALVLEPCTGTGAVALAVATEVASVEVVATDRSPDAVRVARGNLARVGADPGLAPGASCAVMLGDLLTPVPSRHAGAVDVLVANPPYLTPAEVAAAPPEVSVHEPLDALVGGLDGHAVVDRLLDAGRQWLAPGGWLLVEVGDVRAGETAARAVARGYRDVAVHPDLTGRDRVVAARHPGAWR